MLKAFWVIIPRSGPPTEGLSAVIMADSTGALQTDGG